MTKPRRRRRAGDGTVSRYQIKAAPPEDNGVRYLIKYKNPHEGEGPAWIVRRGFVTDQEAEDFLADVLYEIRKGKHIVPTQKTTGKWLDEWLESLRLAPSTMASYRKNVRLHIKPHLDSVLLEKLTGTQVTTVYRKLEAGGRQDHKSGTGLSARTVRYCHTILKAALREAVAQGLIAANPADRAKPPTAKEAKPPEIHPWTAPELSAFLRWADERGCIDAVAWRVLGYTGMRRGEALARPRCRRGDDHHQPLGRRCED
jgi:integrase